MQAKTEPQMNKVVAALAKLANFFLLKCTRLNSGGYYGDEETNRKLAEFKKKAR